VYIQKNRIVIKDRLMVPGTVEKKLVYTNKAARSTDIQLI